MSSLSPASVLTGGVSVGAIVGATVGATLVAVFFAKIRAISGVAVAIVVGTALAVGVGSVGAVVAVGTGRVGAALAVGTGTVAVGLGSSARMTIACGVSTVYVTATDVILMGAGAADVPQAAHKIVATIGNLRNKCSAKRVKVCMHSMMHLFGCSHHRQKA